MKTNQAYFKALIWLLTPTILIFLISLIVTLSFETTKELFLGKDYYPFRIFLVIMEIVFYGFLVHYYQKQIKEKYYRNPERLNDDKSKFKLLQDNGGYFKARENITERLYAIHNAQNNSPDFRVSHREEGDFNYYIVETIKK